MDKKRCSNCKYYKYYDIELNIPRGECRRRAPNVILGEYYPIKSFVFWPRVLSSDYCGEFESKEKEE